MRINYYINKIEKKNYCIGKLNEKYKEKIIKSEDKKQLIEDVRNRIDEQRYNNNVIDFGRESSDFTKANININAGYLAASQANIVQEQSVRLLS